MRIVVWMNQPSHYQTAFFRELAGRADITLAVVYATDLPLQRRALGWTDIGQEKFTQTFLGRGNWMITVLRSVWRERRSTHLVNGVWSVPQFVLASWLLWIFRATLFFHSEAPNPALERRGILGWGKRLIGRCMVNRSRGIFVIGRKAARYYRSIGVLEEKIFKFAYFVTPTPAPADRSRSKDFQVVYVGQFVERKGVAPLIEAIALIRRAGVPVKLCLVGAGPLARHYRTEAENRGIGEYVVDDGPARPEEISVRLASADVVVLPSHFDGWGLTINEALHAGKPVVVTANCGVEELVRYRPEWGVVVKRAEARRLAGSLVRIYRHRDRFVVNPAEVAAVIGCAAMTDYFLASVEWSRNPAAVRPELRWSIPENENPLRSFARLENDLSELRIFTPPAKLG